MGKGDMDKIWLLYNQFYNTSFGKEITMNGHIWTEYGHIWPKIEYIS